MYICRSTLQMFSHAWMWWIYSYVQYVGVLFLTYTPCPEHMYKRQVLTFICACVGKRLQLCIFYDFLSDVQDSTLHMYVCMYVGYVFDIIIQMHVCVCVNGDYIYICTYVCVCTCVDIHACVYLCTYVYMYVCVRT